MRVAERGYFPSYNVPYFAEIYEKSGYPAITQRFKSRDDFAEFSMALAGLSYQVTISCFCVVCLLMPWRPPVKCWCLCLSDFCLYLWTLLHVCALHELFSHHCCCC